MYDFALALSINPPGMNSPDREFLALHFTRDETSLGIRRLPETPVPAGILLRPNNPLYESSK
jgi:hypothetical protein